jgi:pentatricopeptide repeat protein
VGLLNARASIVALEVGRWAHDQILQSGRDSGALVDSSLVDMYAKCGNFGDAWRFFNKMASQDVVTWNNMIGTCTMGVQMMKVLQHANSCTQIGSNLSPITERSTNKIMYSLCQENNNVL